MTDLKEIFEKKIRIEPKVRSIEGLFDIERVKSTVYNPSYQRNYVWDDEKASYFIESIFLGTEIPPLIFFLKRDGEEVIDGRQRYETILNFLNNSLRLKKTGLKTLGHDAEFIGKTFKEMSLEKQDLFYQTRIRTIEFSFLNNNHEPEDEEALKKEIFQRYNSGITPLTKNEMNEAIYLNNDLNTYFKDKISKDSTTESLVRRVLFFNKESISTILGKVRELLVLYKIPIKYYSTSKQNIINPFYEFFSSQATGDDFENIFKTFCTNLEIISKIEHICEKNGFQCNRLVSECLYWALSVVKIELGEEDDVTKFCDLFNDTVMLDKLANYIIYNKDSFIGYRSSFANNLINRYEVISSFFKKETNIDFTEYLQTNSNFLMSKDELSAGKFIENLSFPELRLNKPDPTTEDIDDICRQMKRSRFLLRPSYQRGEVINRKKSSAIIESLLLGIKLPPVFIFKRTDGTNEVVDGQQRLLSILGFTGRSYKDEKDNDRKSKKDGFSLSLNEGILKECHNKTFNQLTEDERRKITRAELWVVEINGSINKNFSPIDLFIRLNNKPYPIKNDTFEMWNSFVDRDIIDTIKFIYKKNNSWFYLRKQDQRMENENMLTTLAYFSYVHASSHVNNSEWPIKLIDIYNVGNRVNCRLKNKHEITRVLEGDNKRQFLDAINRLDFVFIQNVQRLCGSSKNAAVKLNELLAADNGKRTMQSFYILWLLLSEVDVNEKNAIEVFEKAHQTLMMLKHDSKIDYFKDTIKNFRIEYGLKKGSVVCVSLNNIAEIVSGIKINERGGDISYSVIVPDVNNSEEGSILSNLKLKLSDDEKNRIGFILIKKQGKKRARRFFRLRVPSLFSDDFLGITFLQKSFSINYIMAVLNCLLPIEQEKERSVLDLLRGIKIPVVNQIVQEQFDKLIDYMEIVDDNEKIFNFWGRIINIMIGEILEPDRYHQAGINMIEMVMELNKINPLDANAQMETVSIYDECCKNESPFLLLMLRTISLNINLSLGSDETNHSN